MNGDPCVRTRNWLGSSVSLAPPEPALVAHVAACVRCRGALAALLADLLGAPLPGSTSCKACSDDLPAYAELERAEGDVAAARGYPAVWWHLWICPDCAALAEDLAMLLAAEAAGVIMPPPRLRDTPTPPVTLALPSIRLARAFLHAVFAPQQLLGTTWSSGDDRLLLSEETLPGYRLVIHVYQERPEHWALELSVAPPVAGDIVVRFAEAVFREPLIDGLTARLGGIPAALLTDQSGPDMLLTIEREVGHTRAEG
jgi:hypothetical protein